MLIVDLTHDYKYRFDSHLVEECLSDHYFKSEIHWFRRFPKGNAIPFVSDYCRNGINSILEQIPIYLVSSQQSKQTFDVSYWGRIESVLVPEDKLEEGAEGKYEEETQDRIAEDGLREIIDLFGLYQRRIVNIKNGYLGIENVKPSIFIWVNKIQEYVDNRINRNDFSDDFDYDKTVRQCYKALTTLVILHELMHAIMDNCLLGINTSHNSLKTKMDRFDIVKEESLANAMALVLMKHVVNYKDWNFVVDFVRQQPPQYSLGLKYLSLLVFHYAEDWVSHKDGHQFDPIVMDLWLTFVDGAKPLDTRQLKALEDGLQFPEGLFRFNGVYYNNHDVCVEVIKHFAKNTTSLTRNDLHNAFPDSLNHDYESIINYPQTKVFHDKGNGHTRSADDDKIIHCQDGDVAVCDYWHHDDMPGFVENAIKLGIDIETF